MSRTFGGYTSEGSVATVNSGEPLNLVTMAAWVFVTDYQSGAMICVKDPTNDYFCYLEMNDDGTLFSAAGTNYLGSANSVLIVAPGTGYATNDTGFLVGNNPDIPANQAEYRIGGAPGGVPTDPVSLLAGGTGFAVGQTYTTVRGGGQPGGGSGLTLQVQTILNQTNAGSGSVESVPLNTWTHVAMTWDSNGDGLVRLYINGVECTYQGQRTVSIHPNTTTGPYVIGDDLGGFTFKGSIAEVAISETTKLSLAQIASIAASTTGLPGGLTGLFTDYLHLCGLSSPEPNVLSPSNTGTVTNASAGPNSPGYTACGGALSAGGGGSLLSMFTPLAKNQIVIGSARGMRNRSNKVTMS